MPYRPMDRFPPSDATCTVYLLHFSAPLGHAQHYIGMTKATDVMERVAEHQRATGKGAVLCKRAVEAGLTLTLARVWENVPRYTEQRLKNMGGASRLCPICKAERRSVSHDLGTSADAAESGEVGSGEREAAGA